MSKHKKYDNKTYALIKKLNQKFKELELKGESPNKSDIIQYNKLLKGEETYDSIQEIKKKAKNDIYYFINEFIYVRNKLQGREPPEHLKPFIDGDRIKFQLQDIQKELIEKILNHDKVVAVKSRQIGFTTTTVAAALHLATFENNKKVVIVSQNESKAKDTLDDMKFMQLNLPFFLRRKAYKNNMKTLALGDAQNHTSITSLTSGKNTGRGISATQLILDEAEFIQNIEDLQASVSMTLSATGGKAIVLSTPQEYGSWFYELVKGAKEGKNGFVLIEGYQKKAPGRDENQYKEQCKILNQKKDKIKTELDMEWIVPGEKYFKEEIVENKPETEIIDYFESVIEIYEKPKKENSYLISVDPQEGGNHYSGIAVQNIQEEKLVAATLTRLDLVHVIYKLHKYYNNASIIIEANRGYYLLRTLMENYPDIIKYLGKDLKQDDKEGRYILKTTKIGFNTDERKRKDLLSLFSKYVYESESLPKILKDELLKFVIKNGKPKGLEHDDLIFASAIGYFYLQTLKFLKNKSKKDVKKIIDTLLGVDKEKKSLTQKKEKSIKSYENFKDKVLSNFIIEDDYENLILKNQIDNKLKSFLI